MREIDSTLTSKGQVTIPAEVRRHLGIKEGDTITFTLDEEGTVRVKVPRFPTISSLRGAAGSLPEPRPWEEVESIAHEDRAIERGRTKDG